MPPELVLFAGVLALGSARPRIFRPASPARLSLEELAITLVVLSAFAAAWALHWWIE
jgi:hypothetical protein